MVSQKVEVVKVPDCSFTVSAKLLMKRVSCLLNRHPDSRYSGGGGSKSST